MPKYVQNTDQSSFETLREVVRYIHQHLGMAAQFLDKLGSVKHDALFLQLLVELFLQLFVGVSHSLFSLFFVRFGVRKAQQPL